jgi:hypothetical protein
VLFCTQPLQTLLGLICVGLICALLALAVPAAHAARPDDFPRPDGLYAGLCPVLQPDGFSVEPGSCDDPDVTGPRNFEPITVRTIRALPTQPGELPRTVLEVDASMARSFLLRTFDAASNRCTDPKPEEYSGDNALYRFTAEAEWRRDPNNPGWVMVRPAPYVAPLIEVGKTTTNVELSGTLSVGTFFPNLGMSVFQTGDDALEGSVIKVPDLGCAFPAFRFSVYDRRNLGARRIGPAPPVDGDGVVRGRVVSSVPVVTDGAPNDIHFADVVLYRQVRRWLPAPMAGQPVTETIDELLRLGFLTEVGRQVLARDEAGQFSPFGEAGRFEFEVPRFVPRPDGSWERAQYLALAESGLSDELVFDSEVPPNVIDTRAVHFLPAFVANVSPDDGGSETVIEVDPFPPLSVKRELAEALTAICPLSLGPVEAPVFEYLDQLASTPGDLTEAQAEGIERGIWAERGALVGARLADELIEQSLNGFARLLSDLLGDFAKFKSKDIAAAEKRVKAMRDAGAVPPSTLGNVVLDVRQVRSLSEDEFVAARGQVVGAIRKAIGLVLPFLEQSWIEQGMDPAEARDRATKVKRVVDILARNIETATLSGALKSELQRVVRDLVRASKGAVMDSPGASWCALLAPALSDANDRMIGWSQFDPGGYRLDRDRAAANISFMSDGATAARLVGIGYEFLAEASSITQSVGEIVQVASPQARGATRAAQATKYASNLAAGFEGMASAFGFGLGGSVSAIDAALPSGSPSPARAAYARASAGAPQAASAPISPDSSDLQAALDALEAELNANRADQAALLTIASEPGSFARLRADWIARVDAFMTQLGGLSSGSYAEVADLVEAVLDERAELTLVEMNLGHRLTDLLIAAYSQVYSGASDPAWRSDRARVVALIQALRAQIVLFDDALSQLGSAVASEALTPALDLQIVSLGDAVGGATFVSESPQQLALVIRVHNLSDVSLPAFEVNVEALSPTASLAVQGAPVQAIAGLGPDDGVAGSGDDEEVLMLQVVYDGSLSSESMLVRLFASEGGEAPSSFVASEARSDLLVDPQIADADLDGLPTAWEVAVGLDPAFDDAALDLDGDGLSNALERDLGTAPSLRDTDDDGLDDDEELFAGADGFRTDPLDDDSDRDGVLDGADGAPTDASTTLATTPPPEPRVAIDRDRVTLASAEDFAGIEVSNAGEGDLVWSVQPEDPGLVRYDPGPGELGRAPSLLFVKVRPGVDLDVPFETRLHIVDAAGGEPDFQTVTLVSAVPEPGRVLMMLSALSVLGWLRRHGGAHDARRGGRRHRGAASSAARAPGPGR